MEWVSCSSTSENEWNGPPPPVRAEEEEYHSVLWEDEEEDHSIFSLTRGNRRITIPFVL